MHVTIQYMTNDSTRVAAPHTPYTECAVRNDRRHCTPNSVTTRVIAEFNCRVQNAEFNWDYWPN